MNRLITVCSLLCFSGCAMFSGEKQIKGVIVSEQIFVDSNPSSVYIRMDGVVTNLKSATIAEVQLNDMHIAEDINNADVLLKVKTLFNGRLPTSRVKEIIQEDLNVYDVDGLKHRQEKKELSQSKIDKLIEDPSGMLIGFAVGVSMSNPMVSAPIGMAVGAGLNLAASTFFSEEVQLTVLEVEIHEKSNKSLWYTDKRIHKKDQTSIRKYEFSEETNRKVYKTRVLVYGKPNVNEVAKRLASFVI